MQQRRRSRRSAARCRPGRPRGRARAAGGGHAGPRRCSRLIAPRPRVFAPGVRNRSAPREKAHIAAPSAHIAAPVRRCRLTASGAGRHSRARPSHGPPRRSARRQEASSRRRLSPNGWSTANITRSLAEHVERAAQRRVGEEAARRDVEVALEVRRSTGSSIRVPTGPSATPRAEHAARAVEHERQHLAHVADDHLQRREAVEDARRASAAGSAGPISTCQPHAPAPSMKPTSSPKPA